MPRAASDRGSLRKSRSPPQYFGTSLRSQNLLYATPVQLIEESGVEPLERAHSSAIAPRAQKHSATGARRARDRPLLITPLMTSWGQAAVHNSGRVYSKCRVPSAIAAPLAHPLL